MTPPEDRTAELRHLVRAGSRGVRIGDGLRLGSALLFGLHGLATITNGKTPPQRAIATGRAPAALRHAEMDAFS